MSIPPWHFVLVQLHLSGVYPANGEAEEASLVFLDLNYSFVSFIKHEILPQVLISK